MFAVQDSKKKMRVAKHINTHTQRMCLTTRQTHPYDGGPHSSYLSSSQLCARAQINISTAEQWTDVCLGRRLGIVFCHCHSRNIFSNSCKRLWFDITLCLVRAFFGNDWLSVRLLHEEKNSMQLFKIWTMKLFLVRRALVFGPLETEIWCFSKSSVFSIWTIITWMPEAIYNFASVFLLISGFTSNVSVSMFTKPTGEVVFSVPKFRHLVW